MLKLGRYWPWKTVSSHLNSPFWSSLWPLNWRSEDAFFTALASIWKNIFTNSNKKMTCLLLCLLCIFKFQTLTCQNFWIFYFTSRVTLYECVVNICIQRRFLIRNWTISKFYFLCSLSFTDTFMELVLSFKFHISLDFTFLFFFIQCVVDD